MNTPQKTLSNALHQQKLEDYILILDEVNEGRFEDEVDFTLYLDDGTSRSSHLFAKGKYFAGRTHYQPWVEISYKNTVSFDHDSNSHTMSVRESEIEYPLYQTFSDLLPPGSHMMVGYATHQPTRTGLEHQVPPPATPIGYLLWNTGFTWFKDWYIAEGFTEGQVKLQGNKPLDQDAYKRHLNNTREAIQSFLTENASMSSSIFEQAEKRAKKLLESM